MRKKITRFRIIDMYAAAVLMACLFAPLSVQGQEDSDINLVFTGTGSAAATQTTFVNQYDRRRGRGRHTFATAQTMTRRQFSGSGYVEISGRFARLKLPSGMLPPIRSSNDGWFNIQDMFMNDREITGSIRINALNKPRVHIDRTTGMIEIKGSLSEFVGQCEKVDESAGRKF